jgi:hypothetical protein
MGTALVVWLVVVVIASAAWEMRRVGLAHGDVTSKAWQERHTLLRKQLEHTPSDRLHDQFERRLAQAATYARTHNQQPEQFLDATTAREVRVWQQHALIETQARKDVEQRMRQYSVDNSINKSANKNASKSVGNSADN